MLHASQGGTSISENVETLFKIGKLNATEILEKPEENRPQVVAAAHQFLNAIQPQ